MLPEYFDDLVMVRGEMALHRMTALGGVDGPLWEEERMLDKILFSMRPTFPRSETESLEDQDQMADQV